jgi:hypothetical protein
MDLVRDEVAEGHRMLDGVMNEMAQDHVVWTPGGTANNIGQLLAHVVSGQDAAVNMALGGGTPLFDSGGWAAKTGIPANRREIWQKDWTLNLDAFLQYKAQVWENVEGYFAKSQPTDFDREVEWVGRTQPAWWVVRQVIINHILLHSGEMSTLKGIQGLKGLPF